MNKINKNQRIEMLELGFNPINPSHIEKYLKGQTRPNPKENEERIRAIMGEKLNVSLGHDRENDRDVVAGQTIDVSTLNDAPVRNKAANINDIKSSLRSEIDYSTDNVRSVVPNRSGSGLRNLRENDEPARSNSGALNPKAFELGQQLATDYYNAFIMSLKKASTANNMLVYKALQAMLTQEKALQGKPSLQSFQEGVREVTNDMYVQIKG